MKEESKESKDDLKEESKESKDDLKEESEEESEDNSKTIIIQTPLND